MPSQATARRPRVSFPSRDLRSPNPLPERSQASRSPSQELPPGKPAAKPGTKPIARQQVLRSQPADLEALAAESLGLDEKPTNGAPTNGANGSHTNGNGTNGAAPTAKPPIKFACNFCDEEVAFDADQAGKQVQCPSCTRIVRVPMPKETKAKDWRTVEKKGPSAAVSSQPEKLENAWGTENNAKVSQKALIEAGVVAKAPKKTVPLDERIARWVKRGLLAAVVLGVGAWLYAISRPTVEDANFKKIDEEFKKLDLATKWPPVLRAEFYRVLGQRRLGTPNAAIRATEQFMLARDAASQPADAKQKLDCEFFLIDLTRTQIELGGTEAEILDKRRLGWERDLPMELVQTLGKIDNPECRLLALHILKQPLADRKQEKVYERLTAEFEKAFGDQLDAQIEAAEKVRQGKFDDSLKEARDKKVSPAQRFDLAVGVATFLREEMPDKTDECKKAIDLAADIAMNPDYHGRLPQWPLLQLVRLAVRTPEEAELAPKLIEHFREKSKDKPFERRAKFEIQLSKLEKAPNFDDATSIIAEVEPDGQGIAWMTWARATSQAKGAMHPPEADEKHFDFLYRTALPILVPEAP